MIPNPYSSPSTYGKPSSKDYSLQLSLQSLEKVRKITPWLTAVIIAQALFNIYNLLEFRDPAYYEYHVLTIYAATTMAAIAGSLFVVYLNYELLKCFKKLHLPNPEQYVNEGLTIYLRILQVGLASMTLFFVSQIIPRGFAEI